MAIISAGYGELIYEVRNNKPNASACRVELHRRGWSDDLIDSLYGLNYAGMLSKFSSGLTKTNKPL